MRFWGWKTYAAMSAVALGVFFGRVFSGMADFITGLALFAAVLQGVNAYLQWSRPR